MTPSAFIYLDHNATTPLAPSVLEAMVAALCDDFGNPSSIHRKGSDASYAVEKARRYVSRLLGAPVPESVLFTSGGTESDNLAIRGAARAARRSGRGSHLITSRAEHKAVLDTCRSLEREEGFSLTVLPVDEWGRVAPEVLAAALQPDTILVSLMLANNEVGSLNPIASLTELTHRRSRAIFHTDAVQAVGRIPIDVVSLDVDLLSLSAHKLRGPKGVGALFVRPDIEIAAVQTGGGQERELRGGTVNAPGIVGLGEAARVAAAELATEAPRQEALREKLWQSIRDLPGIERNTPDAETLPGTLSVSVRGLEGPTLVRLLDEGGVAISAGSACSSKATRPSHVLEAMLGGDVARIAGAIRVSLGRTSTEAEVEAGSSALRRAVVTLLDKK